MSLYNNTCKESKKEDALPISRDICITVGQDQIVSILLDQIKDLDLGGYALLMQVKKTSNSSKYLLEYTECGEKLTYSDSTKVIKVSIANGDVYFKNKNNEIKKWVYGIIGIHPEKGTTLLVQGSFIVYPEVVAFRQSTEKDISLTVSCYSKKEGTTLKRTDSVISALTVLWEDEHGIVRPAEPNNLLHVSNLVGIAITASKPGGIVEVRFIGEESDTYWNFARGRIWLGAGGSLTQVPPESGYDVLVGYAVSKSTMYINIQDYIYLEE